MTLPPYNGWSKHEEHVIRSLARIEQKTDALDEKVEKINIRLSQVELKAAALGLLAGAAITIVAKLTFGV